jgi:hypothetical protein
MSNDKITNYTIRVLISDLAFGFWHLNLRAKAVTPISS